MSLQPVSGLLATVIDLSEIDPDAASELIRYGLYESLKEQIEKSRPALEADALQFISKQASRARSHLLRTYVGKALEGDVPADATQVAQNLAIIEAYVSKAGIADRYRQYKRDAHGRFNEVNTLQLGGRGGKNTKGFPPETRHDMHGQEAKSILEQAKRQKRLDGNDQISLLYRTTKGRKRVAAVPMKADDAEAYIQQHLGDENAMLVGLQTPTARTRIQNPQHRAAYDAMAGFTSPNQAGRLVRNIPDQGSMSANQTRENWNNLSGGDAADPNSVDRRAYRRMSMTGNALMNTSESNTAQMVGGLASLIGDLGPEAEAVLSPGFTRVAYRYRGTEKRPDAEIVSQMKEANSALAVLNRDANLPHKDRMVGVRNRNQQRKPGYSQPFVDNARSDSENKRVELAGEMETRTQQATKRDTVRGVLGYYSQMRQFRNQSPDQREMSVRGDIVAADLASKVPDKKLAELSVNSGQTPPSVGVMIDSDGRVVTQAMGFNGDHYLPFDLKNLKGLHGGQYIRTRTTGGPSTEDIYTSLMSGARQMQIVSNSGVFTVELDPDLRGGRRYSDKADKMVSRYGHLLDAIAQPNKLYRQDVSPETKAELYDQAVAQVGYGDEKARKDVFQELLQEERLKASGGVETGELTGGEKRRDRQQRDAEETVRNTSPQAVGTEKEQLIAEAAAMIRFKERDQEVEPYQLDGPGYYDALRALQTEFPYFIRKVSYQELPEFFQARRLGRAPIKGSAYASDRSYVAPGQNRASAEHKGYYGEGINAGVGKPKRKPKEGEAEVDLQDGGETKTTTDRVGGLPKRASTTPVKAELAGMTVSPVRDTVTFEDALVPASRQLASNITPIMSVYNDMYGDLIPSLSAESGLTSKQMIEESPAAFTTWKWKQFTGGNQANRFSTWLLNDASDEERDGVKLGLTQAATLINRMDPEPKDALLNLLGGPSKVGERVVTSKTLIDISSPFAPASDDMRWADPETDKPQPFEGVVAMGVTPENYTNFEKLIATRGKYEGLRDRIKEFSTKDNARAAQEIRDLLVQREQLENRPGVSSRELMTLGNVIHDSQVAWAFVRGRDLANKVETGSFNPKEWAPQKGELNKSASQQVSGRSVDLSVLEEVAKVASNQSAVQEYLTLMKSLVS
jgi:hypothetical protein